MIHRSFRQPHNGGAKPDPESPRDLDYAVHGPFRNDLRRRTRAPFSVALQFPTVWDQLGLESCSVHMVAGLVCHDQIAHGEALAIPSRLGMYYDGRLMSGEAQLNTPIHSRAVIDDFFRNGALNETDWPYNPARYAMEPTVKLPELFRIRLLSSVKRYKINPRDTAQVMACLGMRRPFGFVMALFESWDDIDAHGVVPMPELGEKMIGFHYVDATGLGGYGTGEPVIEFRNSYSTGWGRMGYGFVQQAYLRKYAGQGWTFIRRGA